MKKVNKVGYKGIIFDLDGTLIDTLEDLSASMNYALTKLGCAVRNQDECRQMIGNGLTKFAERALPEDRMNLRNELMGIMVAHYQQHCLVKTAPYDGILHVVRTLQEKGIQIAILTNKNKKPAEAIVRHFWNDETFDPVVGVCDGRKIKPDPQSTRAILERWKLTASEVIFIGDSEVDIQTANAAGVASVGCEWGFRNREQLLAAGAKTLIQKPEQILDFLS
jgi:phosphoglycolate phosphatase